MRVLIESFPTPLGWFTVAADEGSGALLAVHIGECAAEPGSLGLPRGCVGVACRSSGGREVTTLESRAADSAAPSHGLQTLTAAREQLEQYAAGERTEFDLPLGHRHGLLGTEFQRRAWDALLAIPFAETRSYAQQAQAIGNPKAVRAIGAANGQNRLAVVIPCHRVIGSGGALVGYAGGVDVKKRLLEHERAMVVASARDAAAQFDAN